MMMPSCVCGLTPKSFPAHLHSSLLEGVAGHAICANERVTKSYYAGGGEHRFICRFMKQWVNAVNQRKSGFVDLGRVIMNSSCIHQEDSYVTHILISLYTPGHTFSVEGTWILRDGNSVTMDCRHGTRWNINIMIIMSSIIGIHEINHRNILKTLKYKPKCAKHTGITSTLFGK